jgi:hypothetical protein
LNKGVGGTLQYATSRPASVVATRFLTPWPCCLVRHTYCPTPKTINKAGDSRNVEIRSFGQGEKFGQPSLTETTEDSRGTFRSIVHRVGIALRALYKPSNPAPAFKIFPIPDEHLPKCAGCGAQWDNHDTGCYCMWGREPSECEGPND